MFSIISKLYWFYIIYPKSTNKEFHMEYIAICRKLELVGSVVPTSHHLGTRSRISKDTYKKSMLACQISDAVYRSRNLKVRGPFVQTLCIEKDAYMDAI